MKAFSESLTSFRPVLHLCEGENSDEPWKNRERKGKDGEEGRTSLELYHPTITTHRAKAHYRMGMVYLSMENFENSKRHLSLSLFLSPEDPNTKNALGRVVVEEEKKKQREKKLYSNMFG